MSKSKRFTNSIASSAPYATHASQLSTFPRTEIHFSCSGDTVDGQPPFGHFRRFSSTKSNDQRFRTTV